MKSTESFRRCTHGWSLFVLILAVVFSIIGTNESTFACTCVSSTVEERVSSTPVVFEGRVVKKRKKPEFGNSGAVEIEFKVSKIWKGQDQERLVVYAPTHGQAGCGYGFRRTFKYVVFAHPGNQNWGENLGQIDKENKDLVLWTSLCSGNKMSLFARKTKRELRKLTAQTTSDETSETTSKPRNSKILKPSDTN